MSIGLPSKYLDFCSLIYEELEKSSERRYYSESINSPLYLSRFSPDLLLFYICGNMRQALRLPWD